jgi:hypothetical protein
MKEDRFSRHVLKAFLLSLALYVVGYWFIEHRRVANSPWVVSFPTNQPSPSEIRIEQKTLGLGPVTVRLTSTVTNVPALWERLTFKEARPVPFDVPGGRCIFQDTTFYPGTVVLELGGTTVQMLPRALTVGTNEFPWQAGSIVEVRADGPHLAN